MFKAIDSIHGEEVVSIDAKWRERLEELRTWGREKRLLCQACRQPLWLRAGEIRRWYFAHQHLGDCPYAHESPWLLQARPLLYERLVAEFGDAVTLEKQLDGTTLPRPIDCWVQRVDKNPLAYWIVDAQLKPQQRLAIETELSACGCEANFVFLARLLRTMESDAASLLLSTTERELMHPSRLSELYVGGSAVHFRSTPEARQNSLHYLDAETATLITLRALQLRHPPQGFTGHRLEHLLEHVNIAPKTGEWVHPGEREAWADLKQQRREWQEQEAQRQREENLRRQQEQARWIAAQAAAREREEKARQQHLRQWQQRDATGSQPTFSGVHSSPVTPPESISRTVFSPDHLPGPTPTPSSSSLYGSVAGTCEFCGTVTDDWYSYNGLTKMCRCNVCRRKRELEHK